MNSAKISVLGAGAFGTALACALSAREPITLWSRSQSHANEMRKTRMNTTRLPNIILPNNITITSDTRLATQSDTLLLAVPMQSLRNLIDKLQTSLVGKNLIACCKGQELSTHLGPIAVIHATVTPATAALLTGPSFAQDIAAGLPTALTLACQEPQDAKLLQHQIACETLRIYRTTDIVGAELGGALKNVIAIACGTVIGAGLGESARAALMTRGFAEIVRWAKHLGAQSSTLYGLSGLGDLALTCSSEQSRNFQFGLAIGAGKVGDRKKTVEGIATALSIAEVAKSEQFDMPITTTVAALVKSETDVATAIHALLSRPVAYE